MDSRVEKKYFEQAYELLELQSKILDHLVFSKFINLPIRDIINELSRITQNVGELLKKPSYTNTKVEISKNKIIMNTIELTSYTLAYIMKIKGVNVDKTKMTKEIIKVYHGNTEETLYNYIVDLLENNINELQTFINYISEHGKD